MHKILNTAIFFFLRNYDVFIDTAEFNEEFTLVIRVNRQTYIINDLRHTINVFSSQKYNNDFITITQNPKNQICSLLNFENNKIKISCEMHTLASIIKGCVVGLENDESIIVRTGELFLFSKHLKSSNSKL